MKTTLKLTATLVIAGTLAAGCAPTRTEAEFGDSVRAVTHGQIHDIGAALYPEKEAVTGGSPDRLETVIKTHNSEAADGSRVQTPIAVGAGKSR